MVFPLSSNRFLLEIKKFLLKISGHQQGGPSPFQGPSSYPKLCWWPLIFIYYFLPLKNARLK
jgi:hypothetical protein